MLKKDLWSKILQNRDKTWLLSEAVSQVAPWSVLGPDWYEMVMECLCVGALSLSCRTAVLTLQPKEGDLRVLRSWRQVGLHFADFKKWFQESGKLAEGALGYKEVLGEKGAEGVRSVPGLWGLCQWELERAMSAITTRPAQWILDPWSSLRSSTEFGHWRSSVWWLLHCSSSWRFLVRTHTWPNCSVLCLSTIVPPPQSTTGLYSYHSNRNQAWVQIPFVHSLSHCNTS